jgi:hypothetical protein
MQANWTRSLDVHEEMDREVTWLPLIGEVAEDFYDPEEMIARLQS